MTDIIQTDGHKYALNTRGWQISEEGALLPLNEEVPLPNGSVGNPALIAQGVRQILKGLGVPPQDPHFMGTALRVTRAYWFELCAGLTQDPPEITTFPEERNQMVILRGIPVRSMCAHHLLPFFGTATVAYVPGKGRILGLSKLSRIVEYWSRRPQTQEELTEQIADRLAQIVVADDRGGVGVMIRANHMCMALRGVNHEGDMLTSTLRGIFLQPEVRAEFLDLARRNGE